MVHAVKSKADLDKQLGDSGNKLVVIDFFATWCEPCMVIAPKLTELANEYADRIVVLKVNVDECDDVAMEYNVTSMPTFTFIKNMNNILEQYSGANVEKLVATIERLA